jgi:hypothetical protein
VALVPKSGASANSATFAGLAITCIVNASTQTALKVKVPCMSLSRV